MKDKNGMILVNHKEDLFPGESNENVNIILSFLKNNKILISLFLLIIIPTAILVPEFFNIQNLINVIRQASIIGIVAVGVTFVILTSGIDLSVGGILAVVAVSFALMLNTGIAVPLAILLSLLIGFIMGALNGVGTTFFNIAPFIMTLATMAVGSGFALLLSDGTPVSFQVESVLIDFIGNGSIGLIPGPTILFILIAGTAILVLRYLGFGRLVYAIGGSMEAARLSGIKTTRVLLIVYAISGVCAAVAGLILTSRLFVGHPTAGSTMMLDSIAAVVIGGTSLLGGRGGVGGTIAGALLLAMVANLLNLLGVSPYHQEIAKGLIIVAAILLTSKGLKEHFKQQWKSL